MASLMCDMARFGAYRQATATLRGWMNGRSFDNNLCTSTNDVRSKLKLLGRIQPGQKLNVHSLTLQPAGWGTTIHRTLIEPDSKDNTLAFAAAVIANSFLILNAKLASGTIADKYFCRELIKDLLSAQTGLNNLVYTYNAYPHFTCRLETLIDDELQTPLATLKECRSDLFPDENDVTEPIPINKYTPSIHSTPDPTPSDRYDEEVKKLYPSSL